MPDIKTIADEADFIINEGDRWQVRVTCKVDSFKNRVMGRCMFASAFFVLRGQINGGKGGFCLMD